VFTVAGVAKEVPLEIIFRGIMPFMLAIFAVVVFLTVFPKVATFLPNAMLR
jgi:TRAP-type C4-dicarboxylate transport system permease large subunit